MMKQSQGPGAPRGAPRVRAAAVLALAVLLASGLGFELATRRLSGAATTTPLPPGTLAAVPLTIGNWRGQEAPIPESVIRATDTDDHLSRLYLNNKNKEQVRLWLAYGVRPRDLMPHRPEVCYPGAGWTLDESRTVELHPRGNQVLPCRLHRFARGTFTPEHIIVLSYFVVNGLHVANLGDLREAALGSRRVSYVVQVQVVAPEDRPGAAEPGVRAFAEDSYGSILGLLTQATEGLEAQAP